MKHNQTQLPQLDFASYRIPQTTIVFTRSSMRWTSVCRTQTPFRYRLSGYSSGFVEIDKAAVVDTAAKGADSVALEARRSIDEVFRTGSEFDDDAGDAQGQVHTRAQAADGISVR